MRWWIAPPGPDESLRSILARAAAFYHCEPDELWAGLQAEKGASDDVDDPNLHALRRMAQAIGVPSCTLHRLRVPDAPWRMVPEARSSYCPRCHAEARRADRPVCHQRAWTYVLRTRCPHHGVPLLPASSVRSRWDRTPTGLVAPAPGTPEHAVLEAIERFAAALERSLFFGVAWPEGWRGDARVARDRLLRLTCHTGKELAHVPLVNVMPSTSLAPFVHGPRHLVAPVRRWSWEAFRTIADPAIRRAALWVVARECVPGLDAKLYSGCVDTIWQTGFNWRCVS